MSPRDSPNALDLIVVASRLRPILDDVVFVGGQVTELLITQPGAVPVRPTMDVDLVVEVATRPAFRKVETTLQRLGLAQDTAEGAPICRWTTPEGLRVDVMPSAIRVLGFSNRWYPMAVERSWSHELSPGLTIRIPEPPVFLATKWEAYLGRGKGDVLGSHDVEDVIALVAGRPQIVAEVAGAPPDLRAYLVAISRAFLDEDLADYAVQGAVPDAGITPAVLDQVLGRFQAIASAGEDS